MVHEQGGNCDFCPRRVGHRCEQCRAVLCDVHRRCPCCDGEPVLLEHEEEIEAEAS
jgi:hypothetical protein